MTSNKDLEELIDSIAYQGMSPERILRFKEKLKQTPKAKRVEAFNQLKELFREPLDEK